jgi:hypothetical protein
MLLGNSRLVETGENRRRDAGATKPGNHRSLPGSALQVGHDQVEKLQRA